MEGSSENQRLSDNTFFDTSSNVNQPPCQIDQNY